jgi:S-adenosylmethionine/arginine decarboxylase-like enzyme
MERVITAQVDFTGSAKALDSQEACERLLDAIVEQLGLTNLHMVAHRFEPQGVSIVYLLSESHIALHTWPENGTGYITLSTCGGREVRSSDMRRILEGFDCSLQELHLVGGGR